jgi:peptidoglycan/LPS O-acetylase OafA/YrhL
MEKNKKSRAATFLSVMSWLYIVFALGMIGYAIYQLSNADVQLTFRIATESVFLIIGGALGILAGIFGLVSKNLKRCRLIGLILFAIAAVPLIINLISGDTFRLYWKNLIAIALPFLYLLAALFKRSEKKQEPVFTPAAQPVSADQSKYAAPGPRPAAAAQPAAPADPMQPAEPVDQPEKNA